MHFVKIKIFVLITSLAVLFCCNTTTPKEAETAMVSSTASPTLPLMVGAERLETYLPFLADKTIALLVNQTSMVGDLHLVDTLISSGIKIKCIFAPEHGFRGKADAGQKLKDGIDDETGIPLISLYGKKRKPSAEDLSGVDVVIFDIQDVGARFYTFISSMHYLMESCAENNTLFMVLDRPNPNGHYFDGPILESDHQSFVGMHPVPVVHGMTIGEYAQMVNGEGWLKDGIQCQLKVVPCQAYDHNTMYELPIKPSPNLPNMKAIYLYPSLCFFEGTIASEGRGTNKQFQVYGHPLFPGGDFEFTPVSGEGSKYPKLENQLCRGFDLSKNPVEELRNMKQVNLNYLMNFYRDFPKKEDFFIKTLFFDKLAGSSKLREAITSGKSVDEIRQSWESGLEAYGKMRKKYLLYPDFGDN